MSHDLCRSDMVELARALGVPVPARWTIRMLWRQCIERAKALNAAERARAHEVAVSTPRVLLDGELVRERLAAGGGGASDRDANPGDYCATCGMTLGYVDEGDGSPTRRACVRCEAEDLFPLPAIFPTGGMVQRQIEKETKES